MRWYLQAIKRTTDISGRSTRSEYWYFQLINFSLIALCALGDYAMGNLRPDGGEPWLTGVYLLLSFIPGFGVSIRRLHDADFRGWWLLLGAVPIVGLVVFVLMVLPSTRTNNRFGPPHGSASAANVLSPA